MLKNKPIIKFAILFLIGYFGLTAINQAPGVNSTLNGLFRGISKSFLSTTMGQLKINTKADLQNGQLDDNKMIVEFEWTEEKVQAAIAQARRTGQRDLQVPYRFISYLVFEFFLVPFLFLFSLIIATPMPWKSKLKPMAWATLSMLGFLLIKLYLMTLFSVSKAAIDVYELGHGTMTALQWLAGLMTMGFSVILAFFIWLIFFFRKSDLQAVAEQWLGRLKA